MNKGIELDCLVAERVMGWGKPRHHGERLVAYENGRLVSSSKVTSGGERIDFAPSRDIASAWEVVEHIFRTVQDDDRWWNYTAGSYCCVAGYDMTLARIIYSQPENFPHAVCIAALDAVGFSLPATQPPDPAKPLPSTATPTAPESDHAKQ